jgi:hypothetical protein
MQLREKLTSTAVLHELNTTNGGIVFDNIFKTITLTIPLAVTTSFNFTSAVHTLEITDAQGRTIPFAKGNAVLEREVTR